MSAIGTVPLFDPTKISPSGTLNPQAGGLYTLTINGSNGDVLSVQPDGTWQPRPAGTAGPYELCGLNGNSLVYCPVGTSKFVYPYFASVPNV